MNQMGGLTRLFRDAERVRQNWGWFLLFGILLVILGGVAVSYSVATTLFSVVLFGALLTTTAVVQIIQAFMARKWSGVFLPVLVGILYGIAGLLCIFRPEMSAVSLTLIFSVLLFIGGLFKMITSLVMQFEQWGWVFFNGLITLLLGILIYSEWPISGLFIIGLFIGIDLILAGISWIVLSIAAKE